MIFPVIQLQLVATVLFMYYRALVFVMPTAFIFSGIFEPAVCGTLMGLYFTIGAPLNLLTSPVLSVAQDDLSNNYFWINIVSMLVMVPFLMCAPYVYCNSDEDGVKPGGTKLKTMTPSTASKLFVKLQQWKKSAILGASCSHASHVQHGVELHCEGCP
eukprot:SAG31_NODE_4385_length_3281_cov_137.482401_3_plen_158_part_00